MIGFLNLLSTAGFWPVTIIVTLICWALSPFGLMAVAKVLEDRKVPINPRWQFLAFWPGDLLLGVGIGMLFGYASALSAHAKLILYYAVGGMPLLAVIAIIVALVFHHGEIKAYGPRAIKSPSKVYHDFVLIAVLGTALGIGLEFLAIGLFNGLSWEALWALLPIGLWFSMFLIDAAAKARRKEDRVLMAHPQVWHPIWRRA